MLISFCLCGMSSCSLVFLWKGNGNRHLLKGNWLGTGPSFLCVIQSFLGVALPLSLSMILPVAGAGDDMLAVGLQRLIDLKLF